VTAHGFNLGLVSIKTRGERFSWFGFAFWTKNPQQASALATSALIVI